MARYLVTAQFKVYLEKEVAIEAENEAEAEEQAKAMARDGTLEEPLLPLDIDGWTVAEGNFLIDSEDAPWEVEAIDSDTEV